MALRRHRSSAPRRSRPQAGISGFGPATSSVTHTPRGSGGRPSANVVRLAPQRYGRLTPRSSRLWAGRSGFGPAAATVIRTQAQRCAAGSERTAAGVQSPERFLRHRNLFRRRWRVETQDIFLNFALLFVSHTISLPPKLAYSANHRVRCGTYNYGARPILAFSAMHKYLPSQYVIKK